MCVLDVPSRIMEMRQALQQRHQQQEEQRLQQSIYSQEFILIGFISALQISCMILDFDDVFENRQCNFVSEVLHDGYSTVILFAFKSTELMINFADLELF